MHGPGHEPVIVAPDGRPARTVAGAGPCPRCGAGPERRVPSGGFGDPHPVCAKCGHDFHGERL